MIKHLIPTFFIICFNKVLRLLFCLAVRLVIQKRTDTNKRPPNLCCVPLWIIGKLLLAYMLAFHRKLHHHLITNALIYILTFSLSLFCSVDLVMLKLSKSKICNFFNIRWNVPEEIERKIKRLFQNRNFLSHLCFGKEIQCKIKFSQYWHLFLLFKKFLKCLFFYFL